MNKFFLVLLILYCSHLTHAQDDMMPKTDFTKMYLPVWLEAKKHCLEVAQTMPEEKYGYKPSEESKTFAEQMVHIAQTVVLVTQRYVEGMEVELKPRDAATMSKESILLLVEEGFDYVTDIIQTIDQEQLDETCVMYHSGNTVRGVKIISY